MSDAPAIVAGSFKLDLLLEGLWLRLVWTLYDGQDGQGHRRRHHLDLPRGVVNDLPAAAEDPSDCEFSEHHGERIAGGLHRDGVDEPVEQLALLTPSARPVPEVKRHLALCVEALSILTGRLGRVPGSDVGGAKKEHIA